MLDRVPQGHVGRRDNGRDGRGGRCWTRRRDRVGAAGQRREILTERVQVDPGRVVAVLIHPLLSDNGPSFVHVLIPEGPGHLLDLTPRHHIKVVGVVTYSRYCVTALNAGVDGRKVPRLTAVELFHGKRWKVEPDVHIAHEVDGLPYFGEIGTDYFGVHDGLVFSTNTALAPECETILYVSAVIRGRVVSVEPCNCGIPRNKVRDRHLNGLA